MFQEHNIHPRVLNKKNKEKKKSTSFGFWGMQKYTPKMELWSLSIYFSLVSPMRSETHVHR